MPMPAMPSLSVARLSSVFEDMAGAALKNAVDDSSCVFRPQGIIGDWTAKRTFWNGVHYGIELADGEKASVWTCRLRSFKAAAYGRGIALMFSAFRWYT